MSERDSGDVQKIVDTISVAPGESILVLGHKDGALTKCLLERKARLTVIERETVIKGSLEDYFHKVRTGNKWYRIAEKSCVPLTDNFAMCMLLLKLEYLNHKRIL